MILLDLNQIMIANIFQQSLEDLDENMARHMILNSIRLINNQYKREYGELVVACDSGNYWRKQIFPYYKQNRKILQANSLVDWGEIFRIINKIKLELKENFPFKVLELPTAEADDIIAVLCFNKDPSEKVLIVSSDKDYQQLQYLENIKQFDPIRKKFLTCDNPEEFLLLHIFSGDSSDGIPNILSKDDCFVTSTRQTPLTKKKIEKLASTPIEEYDEILLRNYYRNMMLIDLSLIPKKIQEDIKGLYNNHKPNKNKLMNYFMENRLKNLLECINEFNI